MNYDSYGQAILSTDDLADLLYVNPDMPLSEFYVTDPEVYNSSIDALHLELEKLKKYLEPNLSVQEFDHNYQSKWFMPEEYINLDIAAWLVSNCVTDRELERVAEELVLYQERNLFTLLCYLKYLVDTMRSNNIIWGVGRGSSVSSYVLYLIGVHKINALEYNLDIREFLKD